MHLREYTRECGQCQTCCQKILHKLSCEKYWNVLNSDRNNYRGSPIWCIRSITNSWHVRQVHWRSTDVVNSWKVRGPVGEESCERLPSCKRLHRCGKNMKKQHECRPIFPKGFNHGFATSMLVHPAGFCFNQWEEQREAMGPSGLSTTRPPRVENDGFTRGSPQNCDFPIKHGYGSIHIDIFLVGRTSIYQQFWGSLGTRVLTHPHIAKFAPCPPTDLRRHNNLSHQSYWTKRWLNTFDFFWVWEHPCTSNLTVPEWIWGGYMPFFRTVQSMNSCKVVFEANNKTSLLNLEEAVA